MIELRDTYFEVIDGAGCIARRLRLGGGPPDVERAIRRLRGLVRTGEPVPELRDREDSARTAGR